MTMRIQKGNLLDAAVNGEIPVILHGCNCFHSMTGGIAAEIARRFPEVTEADRVYGSKGYLGKLGKYSLVRVDDELINEDTKGKGWEDYPVKTKVTLDHPFTCINLYTQYNPGKDFIESIFPPAIALVNRDFSGKTIGIPLLGTGIGGSNWEYVMGVLLDHGGNIDWEVYVL